MRIPPYLRQKLINWRTILQHMGKHPTHILTLFSGYPDHLVYMDSCKLGICGVIYPCILATPYIVWQVEFRKYIQDRFISGISPGGDITINDLELVGIVFAFLVLELHLPLVYRHIIICCDNSLAVSWAYKLR